MPKKAQLIVGEKYGKLSVLGEDDSNASPHRHWLCVCECGKLKSVSIGHLKSGHTKSCGCLHNEALVKRSKTHGHAGKNASITYKCWTRMKLRCESPNYPDYSEWGGRGIKVCKEWRNSFEAFLRDMGEKPKGMSLGRIDNNGDYSPQNCRWETPSQQSRNTRQTLFITLNGETKSFPEWCEYHGIKYTIARGRYYDGWSPEKIFSTPQLFFKGIRKTKKQGCTP